MGLIHFSIFVLKSLYFGSLSGSCLMFCYDIIHSVLIDQKTINHFKQSLILQNEQSVGILVFHFRRRKNHDKALLIDFGLVFFSKSYIPSCIKRMQYALANKIECVCFILLWPQKGHFKAKIDIFQ